MKSLINTYNTLLEEDITIETIEKNINQYNIYPQSIYQKNNSILFMVKHYNTKYLIILGEGPLLDSFEGEFLSSTKGKICPTSHVNSKLLRKYFPFTSPVSHKNHSITLGLGDRLGLASIGHIRLLKDYDVFPVLAQQSIRELNLTSRDYNDVLDSASWAVFQEGYDLGFGADGDHLKTVEEVQMALDCGFTMITLDCSDHIDSSINEFTEIEIENNYLTIDKLIRDKLEKKYLNKTFSISDDITITFKDIDFKKIILIYLDTIQFTTQIYNDLIAPLGSKIDFELSIDETLFSTSIEAHFLIASELIQRGVEITSLAPRFYGEFQKGIDYIGEKDKFEKDFYLHFLVSKHFNYKMSVHSGSDKFKVFPIIGDLTKGCYHLKTAGTNWLEALRVIALKDKKLFREIFQFALDNLEKARVYYNIKGDPNKLPLLEEISDENLIKLLDNDDVRQILHITYGLILQEKDYKDKYRFKNHIYEVLNTFEDTYSAFLINHIGKHLEKLKVPKL